MHELRVCCDEPTLCRGESLWAEAGSIPNCSPSLTHVSKAIKRDFRDKTGVRTLRDSDLEKKRRTDMKANIDSWKIS